MHRQLPFPLPFSPWFHGPQTLCFLIFSPKIFDSQTNRIPGIVLLLPHITHHRSGHLCVSCAPYTSNSWSHWEKLSQERTMVFSSPGKGECMWMRVCGGCICVWCGFMHMCIHISGRGSVLRVTACFLNAGGSWVFLGHYLETEQYSWDAVLRYYWLWI